MFCARPCPPPPSGQAHANLANALQQLGQLDLALLYYQVGAGGGSRLLLGGLAALARQRLGGQC